MRKIFKSKRGVTILEGLIALTLLALVATGTFAVLLSTSRKSSGPDIREEMALAVERAGQLLQAYVYPVGTNLSDVFCSTTPAGEVCTINPLSGGLCNPGGLGEDALSAGTHDIECLLPPVCDKNKDSIFTYTVSAASGQPSALVRDKDLAKVKNADGDDTETTDIAGRPLYKVQFYIKCNGFTL